MRQVRRLAVVGAGAWGTALALTAARAGLEVVLWAREAGLADAIAADRRNNLYLPGVELGPSVRPTARLAEAAGADAVLLVTPAQHSRTVAADLAAHLPSGTPVVICAKGIERGTGALMTEAVGEALPGRPLAVLSGPTFAVEVARGLPAAATLACADAALGEALAAAIGGAAFRTYLSTDLIGAQIGGAVKNVIAIACGICEGRGLGENARAALLTRGAAEMTRLALAKGGRAETLAGLSGIGDLVLTATSAQSRNYSLGRALGEGSSLEEILGRRRSVAEGVASAGPVLELAGRLGVDMPITAAVAAVTAGDASIADAIGALLARPQGRAEAQ